MRLLLRSVVALQLLVAHIAVAQVASTPEPADSGSVTGTVYDSLARQPLADAIVQLVGSGDSVSFSRSAITDSLGRYILTGVPRGRYVIGFLHPVLDSMQIGAPLRSVALDRPSLRIDLAIPSPQSLSKAICQPYGAGDSVAAVVGIVRDAVDRAPTSGAEVTAEWLEISIASAGIGRSITRRQVQTRASGWFSLCDVPRGGAMLLSAMRGAGNTDTIAVDVPASGFLRRDLFLGTSRTIATVRTPALPDSHAAVLRSGDGRLRGVVVEADGGRRLPGARVRIAGAGESVSDEGGAWTLADVPTGTRVLEVRAVGFYPVRRAVEVVADPPMVTTAMQTMRAVLDTVRVVANRSRLRGTGFDERRRSGMGRYITSEDLAHRLLINTSDVFRTVPGMQLDRQPLGDTQLSVRGPFGRCRPTFVVDGHMMRGLTADDIDAFVHPDEIAGVEVYTGAMVPPQFQEGLTGCGTIVIWTSPSAHPVNRWPAKRRALHGLGTILMGFAIGTLLARL